VSDLSQGQLDAVARQRGFPNYATWAAWQQHRQAGLQQAQQPEPPQNFLQSILGKIPIHPSYLLNYVTKKFNEATGD
jgi:hypothetical protein